MYWPFVKNKNHHFLNTYSIKVNNTTRGLNKKSNPSVLSLILFSPSQNLSTRNLNSLNLMAETHIGMRKVSQT